jgi:hypothetical protein
MAWSQESDRPPSEATNETDAANLTFDGDGILEAGEDEATELVRAAQNPVADLISFPLQNNTNFQVGPNGSTQNVLNIQPVVPFNLNEGWNLITRTIVPVINQPALYPGGDRECGLGDTNFTMFLSPVSSMGPGEILWGFGPSLEFPTATEDVLGTEKWSAGPSFVALTMKGPWVFGGLVRQIWSYAGDGDRASVNQMLLQPFINYNLPDNWYLTSSPIITANWQEDSSDQWTIPVGGGLGKLMFLGKLPVNVSCQAYYNVESPENGADWTLRLQVQFLFPKSRG